jgi:hypothetical protein
LSLKRARSVDELLDQIDKDSYGAALANIIDLDGDFPIFRLVEGRIEGPRGGNEPPQHRANRCLADLAQRYLIDLGAPVGAFYRWTDNPDEIEIARRGQLRQSRNHLAKSDEGGLSVAEGPWYYWRAVPICYLVMGRIAGRGSDGEPLLDPATVQIIERRPMSRREALEGFRRASSQRLHQLEKLHQSAREHLPDPNGGVTALRLFGLLIGMDIYDP